MVRNGDDEFVSGNPFAVSQFNAGDAFLFDDDAPGPVTDSKISPQAIQMCLQMQPVKRVKRFAGNLHRPPITMRKKGVEKDLPRMRRADPIKRFTESTHENHMPEPVDGVS